MRILLISRGYMSKDDPVLGNFEAEQAYALKEAGHEVIIASIDRRVFRNHSRKIGITRIEDKGIPIYNFYFPLYAPVIKKNPLIPFCFSDWFYQKMMLKLYRRIELENWKPDIVYAHYLFNSHMALPLKTKLGIPFVAIEHWSQLNNDVLPPRVKMLGNDVYYNVDKVICVSNATSARLMQHFGIESPVCYNMIDTTSFQYKEIRFDETPFSFVTLGRNTHRKGFDILIRAFQKARLPEDVKLHVIGSGDWGNIEQIAVECGIRSRVKFWGAIEKRSDVVEIMSNCNVFVLPSRKETFGVVYVEAMVMGLPVIATPCGGPEEYVDASNGILVPIEDIDALSAAMEQIYANYNIYNRKHISDSMRVRFAPSTIASQVIHYFEEVLRKS